jgi:hypothetical protein
LFVGTIISLPVVQHTNTVTRGTLDNKYKKIFKLEQHFDATAILTKFFISEISPNVAGMNYLRQHLIKNNMPTPVQEFIIGKLNDLAHGKPVVSDNNSEIDQNSRKKYESDEILIKMKSNISNDQLIVVVAYAIVDNHQKNCATSLVKKMVPDRKFNKALDHMLLEWVDENINSDTQGIKYTIEL